MSVFVTSQGKKKVVTFHRLQCRYIRLFFLPNPNTDSNPSGTRSFFLRNRCNFCFSLIDLIFRSQLFFVASYSLDFIIDVRLTFSLSFTQVKDSLQGAHRALPPYSFCFSLIDHRFFFVSSYSLDLITDLRSTFLQSFSPVRKEQLTRCLPSFTTVKLYHSKALPP